LTPFPLIILHLQRNEFRTILSKSEVLEDPGPMAVLLLCRWVPPSPLSIKDLMAGAISVACLVWRWVSGLPSAGAALLLAYQVCAWFF